MRIASIISTGFCPASQRCDGMLHGRSPTVTFNVACTFTH